jgi:hypothetical protein
MLVQKRSVAVFSCYHEASVNAEWVHVGNWVLVRSANEILSTLDDNGTLDGLPFMPEMSARRVDVLAGDLAGACKSQRGMSVASFASRPSCTSRPNFPAWREVPKSANSAQFNSKWRPGHVAGFATVRRLLLAKDAANFRL